MLSDLIYILICSGELMAPFDWTLKKKMTTPSSIIETEVTTTELYTIDDLTYEYTILEQCYPRSYY